MDRQNEIMFAIHLFIILFLVGGNFYEWWGMKNFNPKVYSIGPKVLNFQEAWIIALTPSQNIFKTTSGSFKILGQNQSLFKYDLRFFGFQIRTAFPFKGSLNLDGGHATISARVPITNVTLFCIWFLFWTTISVGMIFSGQREWYEGFFQLIFGWLFIFGISYFSLKFEKKES